MSHKVKVYILLQGCAKLLSERVFTWSLEPNELSGKIKAKQDFETVVKLW